MKRLGIVAHSAEGASLCFITACREGQRLMGAHMHPEIVVSAIPMGMSMEGWESDRFDLVAPHLERGVEQVAAAGADFFICPDNTAHLVLEQIADSLPIPGLHIAQVVAAEIRKRGLTAAGLLGTKWTMTGSVYANALRSQGIDRLVPEEADREAINGAIFDELCLGVFNPSTASRFTQIIAGMAAGGADCVILGCTEIPLIVTDHNSPLPVLDSTRLLARYAVVEALDASSPSQSGGWLRVGAGIATTVSVNSRHPR